VQVQSLKKMKGIILHGGHGTRLRPLTHTGPKQLLPIANKPMSQYALEDLKKIGVTEIGIIIGNIFPEKVKKFYGDGEKFGVKITYIFQEEPKGIAHAIKLCKEFIGENKFVVYLGDNILRKDLSEYAKKFQDSNAEALILLCEVDDISRFGIAEFDKNNNKIKKIIEKPKESDSNLAVIGIYFLTKKIFDIIEKLKPSGRGELEITEALQTLMNDGNNIEHETITGWWKDTGTPDDILQANKLILESIGTKNQFKLNQNYLVKKNIAIGKNTTISENSQVIGPVIIGNNCIIGSTTKIGPNVSIGDNSTLLNCNIENTIIMKNSKIDAKINIHDSIIASGSKINESSDAKKYQFLLGERSEIRL